MFIAHLSSYVRCVAAFCLASAVAWGATVDFNPSGSSGNWSDPTSWTGGSVPTSSDDVSIQTGKTAIINNYSVTVANSLTVNGNVSVSGNDGTDSSKIFFSGSTPTITGPGTITFNASDVSDDTGISLAQGASLALSSVILTGARWLITQDQAATSTVPFAIVTVQTSATITVTDGQLSMTNGIRLVNSGVINLVRSNIYFDLNSRSKYTQSSSGALNVTLFDNFLPYVGFANDCSLSGSLVLIHSSTYFPSQSQEFVITNSIGDMVGNFTALTGIGNFHTDYPADPIANPTTIYSFIFDLQDQRIYWSTTPPTSVAVSSADVLLTAYTADGVTSQPNNGNIVTYSVALQSGGACMATIIAGPKLRPSSTAEAIRITASCGQSLNYAAAPSITHDLVIQSPSSITVDSGPIAGPFTYGDAPFTLTATTASAGAITWSTSTPSIISISGNTATILSAGSASVTATVAASGLSATATNTASFTISPKNIPVTITDKSRAYGQANPPFTFSFSNADLVNGDSVSVLGSPTYGGPGAAADSTTIAGDYSITATFPSNTKYSIGPITPGVLHISALAAQTITFETQATLLVGAIRTLPATSSAGLTVVYTSTDLSIATISGNVVTALAAGTTTITASQAGDATYAPATSVMQSLVVGALISQTITFGTQATLNVGASRALSATSSSGLTIAYSSSNPAVATVSGDVVTAVAAGTTNITASQAGNATYAAATSVMQPLSVTALLTQSITFGSQAALTVGATRTLPATSSAGLTLTYISSNPAVAAISGGNIVTGIAAGSVDITATQAGNATYAFAPSVNQTLLITAKLDQTITYVINGGAPTSVEVGQGLTLTATTTSGLAITYTSSDSTKATMTGDRFTAVASGTVTVTASQAGDGTFNAATPISHSITVIPAGPSGTTADATSSGASGGCGAGGGVAVLLGVLTLGWRRRN